jgi:hypothetical protein
MFHALRVYSGDKQKYIKENYRSNKKCKKILTIREALEMGHTQEMKNICVWNFHDVCISVWSRNQDMNKGIHREYFHHWPEHCTVGSIVSHYETALSPALQQAVWH